MSNIQPTILDNNDQTYTIVWSLLGNADNGLGASFARYPDRTIAVQGTWGGATLTFQGSFDGGVTWFPLTDHIGNALTFTSNGIALVAENPALCRPITSGGSGTSVNCYLGGTRW